MPYDFDQVIDRTRTNSVKWDRRAETFGRADLLPLWVADMDFPVPPAVTAALEERTKHPIYGYSFPPPAFYDSVVEWIKKRHNWEVKKEWLLVTPGVVPALNLAVLSFTKPGDRVIIQPPVYRPFSLAVKNNGRELALNPLKEENGHYAIDFDDLDHLVEPNVKLMIICSPHNPVGRVWTKDELRRIGEFCRRHRIILVSDEIHSDLVYQNFTHTPIASLTTDFARNTITCLAPSKTFNIAGLATSIVIIPDPAKREQFHQIMSALAISANNPFGIAALTAAYQHGGEWLAELMAYLQSNLDFLMDFFAQRIPQIRPIKPEGTFLVWLDCRQLPLSPERLNTFFSKEAGVGLNDGQAFGPGGEGFARMNIACPRSLLAEALTRIEQAVNKLV